MTSFIGGTQKLYKWRERVLVVHIVKISEGCIYCEFFYLVGVRSFNFEGGARVRRILRLRFGLVCDQQGKKETARISQRN